VKALAIVVLAVFVTGCASSSSQYYEAVQKTAEANALASQAKFDALASIAAAGDGQAASAAVMALALTQTPTVTPVPQQSEALQWASILAAPVSNLGMMWLQTDSTKTMARYNAQVDLARISADASTQQALYGSFVSMGETTAAVANSIDYTPFVDGMVTLGTTGMDNLVDLGTAGFDANTTIATNGMNNLTTLGTNGMNNLTTLGTNGMNNLYGLGVNGFTSLVTLGNNGIDSVENAGIQGMINIRGNTTDWLGYLNKSDLIMQDMLKANGCTITTDSNNKVVVTCN
tara:strand:+ start:1345 stop:2208 length:864 start_codon:yes stop_codon:yes gene_type:complete